MFWRRIKWWCHQNKHSLLLNYWNLSFVLLFLCSRLKTSCLRSDHKYKTGVFIIWSFIYWNSIRASPHCQYNYLYCPAHWSTEDYTLDRSAKKNRIWGQKHCESREEKPQKQHCVTSATISTGKSEGITVHHRKKTWRAETTKCRKTQKIRWSLTK